MRYWNWIVRSHERMSKDPDFPTGNEGLQAVRFLRSFFEQMGCKGLNRNHPLYNRLGIGMEPNYLWLVQYARKLLTARSISGFETVAKRLVDPKEYLAAHNEIEVALKLYLGGLNVSFTSEGSQPIPDLTLKVGDNIIRVEVSSLNPPDEETRVQMLVNQIISSSVFKEVVTGAFVSKVPSFAKIHEIVDQLNKAIAQVNESHKVEKLNFEGVATIYVAPPDMVDQIPKDCRRGYHFIQPYRRSIEEKIERKIKEKSRQLFGDDEPGILFLCTQMIDRQTVSELFNRYDIEIILATYTKLLGLILTLPHLGIGVASAIRTDDLQKAYKQNKVFLESEAGIYQYESSVIWKNISADRCFPSEIIKSVENYPENLVNLAPLD